MTAFCMPRTNWKFRLDDRIIEALKIEAEQRGMSFNAYVESLLLAHGKAIGRIPVDAEPDPDLRGGARKNAGRKKESSDEKRSGAGKSKAKDDESTTDRP